MTPCIDPPRILNASHVAIATGFHGYCATPPFSPAEAPPEYPFPPGTTQNEPNVAYEGVREALRLCGLNAAEYGQANWNPLKDIVRPGDAVVLKPNFVRDFRETQPGDGDCLITHGSVIRAVADYVFLALRGEGRIIVADAPQNDADFDRIRAITGLDAIQEFYRRHAGFELEVCDLRPERAKKIDGVIVGHTPLPGDPRGYVRVNLGEHSMFAEVEHLCHLLYGSEYDRGELHAHHRDGVHEYLISKTVLEADVVIGLPKLKTHKKVGLTVNLKNLVGINGNKNWLPHHREGTPSQGGDQFPDDRLRSRVERRVVDGFKRVFPALGPLRPLVAGPVKAAGKAIFGDTNKGTIRSGNWYGNDTTWRMVLDLNRILLYADSSGRLQPQPVRRFFSLVDGIVAGEGNGPLDPTPKQAGVILAGANPVAIDLACATLTGFDSRRLPMLHRAFDSSRLPLVIFGTNDVTLQSNDPSLSLPIRCLTGAPLHFRPSPGWQGAVECMDSAVPEPNV